MEIRGSSQSPAPAQSNDPSPLPTGGAASSEAIAAQRQAVGERDLNDAVTMSPSMEMPKMPFTRAELSVDRSTQRYVARIVDRNNGKMVAEYPTEAQLKLYAISRELLGKLMKAEA
ncbi:hypothetical protein FRZ61_34900 [Hypericibacter adhaerens]|jgi:uncharacterized FlaG/YvyC family protein|uniref:Flagellar protein FlaG n=1 Tax=Hypericibacter adhaerens TaxID=2602016 RepID=A0A5J6N0P0_9PROT|nr:flagellar protein FlaG [Hypericibacter adhaerens]QEX23552.1 hypothetical protein FRZ61_34900 [Hypericibacter adhaerens]